MNRNSLLRKSLIAGGIVAMAIGWARSANSAETGVLEGHLTIASLKVVEPDDASPSKGTADSYSAYPLLILSKDGKKKVREVTADKDGNYRVSLPPGQYVLDAKRRAPKRIRAKLRKFTVISNQTVRVDFELDTGIR